MPGVVVVVDVVVDGVVVEDTVTEKTELCTLTKTVLCRIFPLQIPFTARYAKNTIAYFNVACRKKRYPSSFYKKNPYLHSFPITECTYLC